MSRPTRALVLVGLASTALFFTLRSQPSDAELPAGVIDASSTHHLALDGVRTLHSLSPARESYLNLRAAVTTPPREVQGGVDDSYIIIARDESGEPIAGVELLARNGEDWITVGFSDASGRIVSMEHELAGAVVLADAAGFALTTEQLPDHILGEFVITLERSHAIRGVLTGPNGEPVGEGVRVCAWPASSEALPSRQVLSEARELALTQTDEAGRFEVNRLSPSRVYTLIAAGVGFVTREPVRNLLTGSEEIAVPVFPVRGAVVRLLAPEGEHAFLSSAIKTGAGGLRVESKGGRSLSTNSVIAALLGVQESMLDCRNPVLLLFTFEESLVEDGGVGAVVKSEALGYAPSSATIQLGLIEEGLPEYQLRLEPTVAGFGSVSVRLLGAESRPPSSTKPHESPVAHAVLSLSPLTVDVPAGRLLLSLPGLESGRVDVGGVPFGDYLARVEFSSGGYAFPSPANPPLAISVSAIPAVVEVPTEGLGRLEVSLIGPDGIPYRGMARIALGHGRPLVVDDGVVELSVGSGARTFSEAPYVFNDLLPGNYTVVLKTPAPAERITPQSLPEVVEVVQGEASRIGVELAEPLDRAALQRLLLELPTGPPGH